MTVDMSDWPHRACINCDNVKRFCPKPYISDDGFGTKMPPDDCPKKMEFKMKEE
jgi:hypothetical protein